MRFFVISLVVLALSLCAAPVPKEVAANTPTAVDTSAMQGVRSQTITLRAVGDVLLGSYTPQRMIPADSGRTFVRNMAQYLGAADSLGARADRTETDIVFGNFEAAFARENDSTMQPQKCSEASRRKGICYEFGVPPHLAPVLKQLGFTVMSVDNNHADDYGVAAAEFTKQMLTEQGVKPAPKRGYALLNAGGVPVAVVAFGFSNTSWNIADVEAARRLVAKLKRELREGADSVRHIIVSFHGGAEGKKATHVTGATEMFVGENRGNVRAFARACVDAGASMVIGHGPHVLRAMEVYNGKLIAYSLGNFLTYGNINVSGISGVTCVLEASFDAASGDFLTGRVIPVVQRAPGIPVFDSTKQSITLLQTLMHEDFPQGALELDNDGLLRVKK
jgi:hypothetical protein